MRSPRPSKQSDLLVSAWFPFPLTSEILRKSKVHSLVMNIIIPWVAFPLWFIWILFSNKSATHLALEYGDAACVKTMTEMKNFCPQDKNGHGIFNFNSVCWLTGVIEKTIKVFMSWERVSVCASSIQENTWLRSLDLFKQSLLSFKINSLKYRSHYFSEWLLLLALLEKGFWPKCGISRKLRKFCCQVQTFYLWLSLP